MAISFCTTRLKEIDILLQFYLIFDYFYCVLCFLFSPVAILGNLLVIRALWKASSISVTLKKLLLSLASSDLAVGLYVQPKLAIIIAIMLDKAAIGNYDFGFVCPYVLTSNVFFAYFLSGASFFTIATIALDRLLAVTLHLRYQELVTDKRVDIAIVGLWFSSGIVSFTLIAISNHLYLISAIIQTLGLLAITVAYLRIYKAVRYHQNQILSQHQIQNGQAMGILREKKSALNAFYIYIITMACYVPTLIADILLVVDSSEKSYILAYYVAAFVICVNSSLNPFVYCWRYREIRNIVKNTVKKTLRINRCST